MKIRLARGRVKYGIAIFLLTALAFFPRLQAAETVRQPSLRALERRSNHSSVSRLLFGEEYFQALHQAFQEARDSILVQMYYIGAKIDDPADPVNILIKDLQDAKERGVEVRVILENKLIENNYPAYNSLIRSGIAVSLDSPATLLHSKAIVIDKKILILGSANWSKSAFYANEEASILTESPELAARLAEKFKNIKLGNASVEFNYNGVEIPARLLTGKNKLPALFTRHSEKSFDHYLLLLKEAQRINSATVALDYEKLAQQMHYKMPSQDTRLKQAYAKFFYFFNIYQPLKKLTRQYKLLEREPWAKSAAIIDFIPKEGGGLILPFEYWDYGLDKQLSFNAKFIYLLALLEAKESQNSPYWFRSQKGLAQKYHIGSRSINQGILELEEEELLEVYRHIPRDPRHPEKRPANDYRLNPLISPADFEKQSGLLAQKYGIGVFNQAKSLSSKLGRLKDLNTIETLILLINKFGYDDTRRAVSRASQKSLESGLRSLTYIVSLLE